MTRTFAAVFEDAESIIADAVKEAVKLVESNQDRAKVVRDELAQVDRKIGSLCGLLTDAAIDDGAKGAISRLVADQEAKRQELQDRLGRIGEPATEGTAKIARAVCQAFSEARKGLSAITTPAQLNGFVERFVGPIEVHEDGTIGPAGAGADDASDGSDEDVIRSIAGAGSKPATLRWRPCDGVRAG